MAVAMPKSLNTSRHVALRLELLNARKDARLTQASVAEALEQPQSYVAKIEGGERRLDVVEFLDFSDALGIDPAALIKRLSKVDRS